VREIISASLGAQIEELEKIILPTLSAASVDSSFVHFAIRESDLADAPSKIFAPHFPAKTDGGMAPDLAAFGLLSGFAMTAGTVNRQEEWIASFARLKDREPFPLDRQAFTYRPAEFLGVCLGAVNICGHGSREVAWLREILLEQQKLVRGRWATWLSCAASIVLGTPAQARLSLEIADYSIEEVSLLLWLRTSKSFSNSSVWRDFDATSLQRQLLKQCVSRNLVVLDAVRAVVLYCGLKSSVEQLLESALEETWQLGRKQVDAIALVTNICRRFHRVAKQLEVRHDSRKTVSIGDEYDVQDLLHSLLLLHFDDVREETWTASFAGSSSRTDFLLWKEGVVVEAKMARKTLRQREITDQLIIDKARYSSDPRCKTIVCFIYDPEGWCKNPAALETDLSSHDSPRTVVIVHSGRS
jgi:hypothetical protein